MELMETGYNLVERNSIGDKYEKIERIMSIVNFLRRLSRGARIPKKIAVTGLGTFLATNDKVKRRCRILLSEGSEILFKRACIIQFIIEGKLVMNRNPRIIRKGRKINLTPVFGTKLSQRRVDWYHSPFNI